MKLAERLDLRDGTWSCGLVDCYLNMKKKPVAPLFLCMDACDSSMVGEGHLPVLRQIQSKGGMDFQNIMYVPVKSQELAQIRVYLRDAAGGSPSVEVQGMNCTLHFVRA